MKLNDIFKRLDPKSKVPVSLFPASSMHRTSMRIGRLTPFYSVNMFQGNRIELSVSQLTRFATLDHPVMNNYEVNVGFFFVPWTAHDEMGTSAWFRKQWGGSNDTNNSNCAKALRGYKLNANEFFNPAFDNALRHHPIMVKLSNLGNIKLVGSLYDHLGYYIGTGVDVSDFAKYYHFAWNAANGATGGTNFKISDGVSGSFAAFKLSSGTWVNDRLGVLSTTATPSTLTNTDRLVMPLDLYAIVKYYLSQDPLYTTNWESLTFAAGKTNMDPNGPAGILVTAEGQGLVTAVHKALGMPYSGASRDGNWVDYFGNLLPANVLDSYNEYLNSMALINQEGAFQANCLDWLNYMRIYADWFLNDHFTRRDDFLDMIGEAYYKAASSNGNWNMDTLFSAQNTLGWSTSGIKKTYDNPELQFFSQYIRRGECMPVLWELSRMTAQRCEVDMPGLAGTDVSSQFSAADTPTGATIREHYFNRAVQKFKDLISRVGYDFRDNTRELYGHGVSDSTLNRSQMIALKRFAVNVGDVQQTSSSDGRGNLGDFAGYAFSKNNTDRVSWTAEQNGTFMVLAWIRPRNIAYATGIDREKMKSDYFDYLIPQFGGVGYQDVSLNELRASAANTPYSKGGAFTAFGKEEIYSEYMSVPNHVTGTMRTFNKNWHSDRFITNTPPFGKDKSPRFLYITDYDDVNRIFSNSVDDPILCTMYFDGNITRQLPSHIKTDF